MSKPIIASLLGYGYFGKILEKTIEKFPEVSLKHIADIDKSKLPTLAGWGLSRYTTNFEKAIIDPEVNCVFVATRAKDHFSLAKLALENDKNVFVEKPMVLNSKDAEQLVDLACEKNLLLHVDSTFVYSRKLRYLADQLKFNVFGRPLRFKSIRGNYGPFSKDIDCVWDLATHDIAILSFLLGDFYYLRGVSAYGWESEGSPVIEEADIHLEYFDDNNNPFFADIEVSWHLRDKIREISLLTEKNYIFFDTEKDDLFKIEPRKSDCKSDCKNDAMILKIPQIYDSLYTEINHFFEIVKQNGWFSLSDGWSAAQGIKVLEAISESIKNKGTFVKIN